MAFDAFTTKATSGAFHQRRAIAYSAAACILVGLGIASASLPSNAEPVLIKEPDPIDVTLEEKIEEEKPEEPPPPPPPTPAPALDVPKHVKISAEPPPPPPPTPDENLKAKLDEADPSKDKGVAGQHGGDLLGMNGGHGLGPKKEEPPPPPPPPKAAPPPPPPKPKGPAMVSEDDTPAKALSTPQPAYPAAARAAGIMGVVVVRLTIDEQGNVVAAKIVKGDPNFDDVVTKAVMGWRYEPAKHQDGKAFLSVKTVKIPFRIKS